jgi:site-specific DNA-methyltransferase (adenine-specific)
MREDVINDDILNVLRSLKDESAQIVIADPPYNIGKDFGNKSDKQPMDEYLRWCDEWIEGCLRVLRKDGTMFIYGFSEILALILARTSRCKSPVVGVALHEQDCS